MECFCESPLEQVTKLKAELEEAAKVERVQTKLNNSFWAECPVWLRKVAQEPHTAMKMMVEELEAADQGLLRMRGKS
jgi:hypothetical protein